ncbi:hypothetical protein BB559_005966 [Furculomyces boomerangus]|uniref:DNA-directed RNA polymerase III subunit Rpc5 n=2 Tax=Harpellales TaxID=61421 RepID=A0A2T9Y5K4_9FUNG|nr:hypothetical protein BB559_005966 [Furculomyces boomerangus]PWA02232.1 hypothetical protein BB558_001627 [Smittium angustum]
MDIDSTDTDMKQASLDANISQKTFDQENELEDPIVARYPLFISEKLTKYLHLFQYPMKAPEWMEQQDQQPTAARVKPNSGIVELEIPINTSHSMYSKEKGAKFAAGMQNSGETLNIPQGKLFDAQTWTSSPITQTANYMIATFIDGELHLTPIKKVSQLRYNLDYIDKINDKIRANTKKTAGEQEDLQATEKTKAKTLQVKVRSSQAEEVLRKQENSISRIRQKISEEPWTNLEYYDHETDESNAVFTQLVYTQKEKLVASTTPSQYIEIISPQKYQEERQPQTSRF